MYLYIILNRYGLKSRSEFPFETERELVVIKPLKSISRLDF